MSDRIRWIILCTATLLLAGCGSQTHQNPAAPISLAQMHQANTCVQKRVVQYVNHHHSMMDNRVFDAIQKACGPK